jgi:hypothetical protein
VHLKKQDRPGAARLGDAGPSGLKGSKSSAGERDYVREEIGEALRRKLVRIAAWPPAAS